MRGLKQLRSAKVDQRRARLRPKSPPRPLRTRLRSRPRHRLPVAFAELTLAI